MPRWNKPHYVSDVRDLPRGAAAQADHFLGAGERVMLFEKAVRQYGFKGYGELVGTLWETKRNPRELCCRFCEKAIELGVQVMIEPTMDRGFSDSGIYEDILRDFPKVRICAGGAGIPVTPVERAGRTMRADDRPLELAEQDDSFWLGLDDWQVAHQKGILHQLTYLRRARWPREEPDHVRQRFPGL